MMTAAVACGGKGGSKVPEFVPGGETPDYGVKVIAHRGFWQATPQVPENSIASLKNSIALGCFGTEFDVWLTADDVPVLHHDGVTPTKGVVIENVTYAELMATDGLLANGEKIPTLDEFLDEWSKSTKKVKLIFEIKTHSTLARNQQAAAKTHATAVAHGITPEQMEYIAFSRDVCKALTGMETGVPVAYLMGDLAPLDAIDKLGVTGIDYNSGPLKQHPEWIGRAQELGLTVNAWTINYESDMRHFIEAGVDYITSDRPDVVMNIVATSK